jgi:hypothetical protein
MPRLRIIFPWALLTVSLTANVLLWRDKTQHPATPSPSLSQIPAASSPRPLTSSAVNSESAAISSPPPSFTPHPSSFTLRSTASRSAAFAGYADLLVEDIKTQEQIDALNQLLARWVATDPTAAATWLGQYDQAPFYDPAALHVTNHLVATERFTEASTWADLISDPSLRETAHEAIIAESFRAKKIDASAVRLSGLPAPRVEAILNGSRLD